MLWTSNQMTFNFLNLLVNSPYTLQNWKLVYTLYPPHCDFHEHSQKVLPPPPFKILDPSLRTENVFPSKIFCGSLLSSSKIFCGWSHLHKVVRKHLPLSVLGPLTPAVMYIPEEREREREREGGVGIEMGCNSCLEQTE